MMKGICLILMLALCLFACGEKNMAETDIFSTAERAVKLCVSEYTRLSGKALFSEVDTAYVHISANRFGVLFTHGEVGTFGERSQDYRAYLSCGVLASDDLNIYYMDSPMSVPLIENPESDSIDGDFYEGNVKELIYRRSGNEFTFVAAQDFVEPDLNLPPRLD